MAGAASVREVLHPVGRLPARVYWRRRLGVLVVLLALLAGGGWLTARLLDRTGDAPPTGARATGAVPTPALEQVLPSLAAVRRPEAAPGTSPAGAGQTPAPTTSAAPAPGGPCGDDMIELTMRAPTRVAAGSSPTLTIVVRNVADVPCTRRLDAELREVQLFDSEGKRVWGSNDCRPEQSDRRKTLAPQQGVALDVVWSGLSSAPGCAGERTAPAPGVYVLRGRLDTATTPDRRMRIS
jgi:hypothetical protein